MRAPGKYINPCAENPEQPAGHTQGQTPVPNTPPRPFPQHPPDVYGCRPWTISEAGGEPLTADQFCEMHEHEVWNVFKIMQAYGDYRAQQAVVSRDRRIAELEAELKRVKEELLIVSGICAEDGDTLPRKEK